LGATLILLNWESKLSKAEGAGAGAGVVAAAVDVAFVNTLAPVQNDVQTVLV
jgi:hypothetical protein